MRPYKTLLYAELLLSGRRGGGQGHCLCLGTRGNLPLIQLFAMQISGGSLCTTGSCNLGHQHLRLQLRVLTVQFSTFGNKRFICLFVMTTVDFLPLGVNVYFSKHKPQS